MKKERDIKIIFVSIVCVLALLAVIFPLLFIAKYNYPSADDWSFGVNGYKILQKGGNFFELLKVTIGTVCKSYTAWEGRFVAVFFAALQPGIWGEQYYSVVTWIMLGAIIFAECLLCRTALETGCRENVLACGFQSFCLLS